MKPHHLAATLMALGWMAIPTQAGACPFRPLDARAIADSEVVFVGTVEGVSDRVATIAVIEVWRGPDLPQRVDLTIGKGEAPGIQAVVGGHMAAMFGATGPSSASALLAAEIYTPYNVMIFALCAALSFQAVLIWYVADSMISRCSAFMLQPRATNSLASQSSSSGCVGASPRTP